MTNFAIIGDSLFLQDLVPGVLPGLGEARFRALWEAGGVPTANLWFYACGGKEIETADSNGLTTAQNVAAARAYFAPGHVDVWLIGLGTNNTTDADAILAKKVMTLSKLIGTEGRTAWIGVGFFGKNNTNAARMNPIIKDRVHRQESATWWDWNAYVHNGRDESGYWLAQTGGDSTHMTPAGYDVRVAYCWEIARGLVARLISWDGTTTTILRPIEYNATTGVDTDLQIRNFT